MDTHQPIFGHSKQAEGVIIPQILLNGKRQLGDVVNRFDIARQKADLIKFLLIKGHMIICIVHHFNKPCRLERPEILP